MHKKLLIFGVLVATVVLPGFALAHSGSHDTEVIGNIKQLTTLDDGLKEVKKPKIKDPKWLIEKRKAEKEAVRVESRKVSNTKATPQTATATRQVTYDVATRGNIRADLAEFKSQANAILNDSRGWAALGITFVEVPTGGQFTLVLSEAAQLPSFSPGCSVDWSCNVGRFVIINQERWLGATVAWNNSGGSLMGYRHMVINHETGHWLGHDHEQCPAAGQPAPLMQQQSIDLQGCTMNPWPLKGELWSTTLGL